MKYLISITVIFLLTACSRNQETTFEAPVTESHTNKKIQGSGSISDRYQISESIMTDKQTTCYVLTMYGSSNVAMSCIQSKNNFK